MHLDDLIRAAVDAYWSRDVEIVASWTGEGGSVSFVYHRRLDPPQLLGRHVVPSKHVADGTLPGIASGVALNMAEPIGGARTRPDHHGVVWVGVPPDDDLPALPDDVVVRLMTWRSQR